MDGLLPDVRQLPVWRLLRRALRGGRLAHAYLLVGEPGTGQEAVALRLAQARCCRQPGADGEPCDQCRDCRLVLAGQHPWVVRLGAGGGSLGIEAVREASRALYLAPGPDEFRVLIVDDAERLTLAAVNRLLKWVEEPPTQTQFLFLARDRAALPETLVSRCQVLRFAGLPEAVLVRLLAAEGVEARRARALARLAGGSPGQARELLARGVLDGTRRQALDGLRRLASGDLLDALTTADAWSKLEPPEELLAILETLIRDTMMVRRGLAEQLVHADLEDDLVELAGGLAPWADVEGALAATGAARRALAAHVPRQLALEVCCMRLQGWWTGRPARRPA